MLEGIDVSHIQGNIDWSKVAGAGKDFAFIKASQGIGYHDSRFAQNWVEARDAGLTVGAYHFITADDAAAQAQNYLRAIQGVNGGNTTFGPGILPAVLDVEAMKGPAEENAAIVRIWLTTVSQATGQQAIVYTSPGWWEGAVAPAMPRPGCLFWLAEYEVSAPKLPTGVLDWTFWQIIASGKCAGVSTPVDLDCFNGGPDELAALARLQA